MCIFHLCVIFLTHSLWLPMAVLFTYSHFAQIMYLRVAYRSGSLSSSSSPSCVVCAQKEKAILFHGNNPTAGCGQYMHIFAYRMKSLLVQSECLNQKYQTKWTKMKIYLFYFFFLRMDFFPQWRERKREQNEIGMQIENLNRPYAHTNRIIRSDIIDTGPSILRFALFSQWTRQVQSQWNREIYILSRVFFPPHRQQHIRIVWCVRV